MKKSMLVLVVVVVLSALMLAACGGGGDTSSGKTRATVPAEYASQTSPVGNDAATIAAGKELYDINCATCHGDTGRGDGPAGSALDPKPANLVQTAAETEPIYSHWVISEGGAAAGLSSSMVAYKGILTDEQIWQIVAYVESLK